MELQWSAHETCELAAAERVKPA
uniref:Uncharacterized protein n=1 Tax=Arundo donax TaxID=35708 RepID=A0A0A9BN09_ARUDO